MGSIADKLAAFTFITSDNPRSERASDICKQIEEGFKGKNYSIVIEREEAIAQAIKLFLVSKAAKVKAKKKTCVLIAGKGHEDYQIIGNKKFPFKDSKVIHKTIKSLARN
jgi:UDP-N-acetylmuramoyl-L-alanyl-D-glutamate--2,6-diaminopimelate ligase